MNETVIEQMIAQYDVRSEYDRINAMKEVIQEIVLCGLSRAGFFKKAAFYGGTALRMFYGLQRFSEDLDFSLTEKNADFALEDFFPVLTDEVNAYGLDMEIQKKDKIKQSAVQSAFVKGNTREHLLIFYPGEALSGRIDTKEKIKIKFEIDTNPPSGATYQRKFRLLPSPYEVNMYDEGSLFAGKIHAVICRGWKDRVKGRDLYDYVFYLSRHAKVNLSHLRARLVDSGYIEADSSCSIEDVRQMLYDRFDSIDFEQAKADVIPFIKDTESLGIWSADFFKSITESLDDRM